MAAVQVLAPQVRRPSPGRQTVEPILSVDPSPGRRCLCRGALLPIALTTQRLCMQCTVYHPPPGRYIYQLKQTGGRLEDGAHCCGQARYCISTKRCRLPSILKIGDIIARANKMRPARPSLPPFCGHTDPGRCAFAHQSSLATETGAAAAYGG